jgi:hypothetical protein
MDATVQTRQAAGNQPASTAPPPGLTALVDKLKPPTGSTPLVDGSKVSLVDGPKTSVDEAKPPLARWLLGTIRSPCRDHASRKRKTETFRPQRQTTRKCPFGNGMNRSGKS